MGQGYGYKCKKCHYEYSVYLGGGMKYPKEYRKKIEEISTGIYGTERKNLIDKTEYAAIDADRVVYVCSACNNWELGTDVTLYAPNEPEKILKIQYGIKTVEEWGYVPYVTRWELKENYHILKRYYHKCKNCGKRMHKASEKEEINLPCPKCGEPNTAESIIMWD